jgi:hypothetical protein
MDKQALLSQDGAQANFDFAKNLHASSFQYLDLSNDTTFWKIHLDNTFEAFIESVEFRHTIPGNFLVDKNQNFTSTFREIIF